MFEISRIEKKDIENFRIFLTDNEYREAVDTFDRSEIYGAFKFFIPVGYLRIFKKYKDRYCLNYLFVAKKHRKNGLGDLFIRKTLEILNRDNITELLTEYTTVPEYDKPVDKLLDKHGFSDPELLSGICYTDRRILRSPWLRRARIPEKYKVIQWDKVEKNIKERLKVDHEKEDWENDNLSPFNDENKDYIPQLSFCILDDDNVLGWIITTLANKETTRYGNIYIRKKYRGNGYSFALLYKALLKQDELFPDIPYGLWRFPANNQERVNFNNRRMGSYLISLKHKVERILKI